jgi:formylglycine-generating enzyme required for sulfatase activity
MPNIDQLPDSLKELVYRNGLVVDSGRDFDQHIERLIRSIDGAPRVRELVEPARQVDEERQRAEAAQVPKKEKQRAEVAQQKRAELSDFAVFRDAPFAPELVVIPAGEFWMGAPEQEEDRRDEEGPQHRVTIGRRFAIGRYPVISAQYDLSRESNRWHNSNEVPVTDVSWHDAQDYVAWISQATGQAYRLPSEAEWEYACRAGTTSQYSFGATITPHDANYDDSGLRRMSEVGAYPPNPWGLYDMHGNVFEWVEDDWHENYRGAPTNGSAWRDAKASANSRLCILRGGSWSSASRLCRSACRSTLDVGGRSHLVGFRVARTLS